MNKRTFLQTLAAFFISVAASLGLVNHSQYLLPAAPKRKMWVYDMNGEEWYYAASRDEAIDVYLRDCGATRESAEFFDYWVDCRPITITEMVTKEFSVKDEDLIELGFDPETYHYTYREEFERLQAQGVNQAGFFATTHRD